MLAPAGPLTGPVCHDRPGDPSGNGAIGRGGDHPAMKVAYVVPRYGAQIRGGAETGARMMAEHLVADRGDEVEVFTTAALDA